MADLRKKATKAYVSIIDRLRKVAVGNHLGQMAAKGLRTVEEANGRPEIAKHIIGISKMADACIVSYPFPENYPAEFRRKKAFEDRLVYNLQNVRVSPYSAMVWTPAGTLLEESTGTVRKILTWANTGYELLLPSKILNEPAPIICLSTSYFYHFFWDYLPNLVILARRYPNLKVLTEPLDKQPDYAKSAFEMVLGSSWKSRMVEVESVVQLPNVIMPQIEVYSGFIHPALLAAMRSFFIPMAAKVSQGHEKIYVSRSRSPRRPIENEVALEVVLKARGFHIIYLESMALLEQFAAFTHAKLVVAPHGAGLVYLGLTEAPPTLLEIYPAGYFNDCFARLALQQGGRYDYAYCTPTDRKDTAGMVVIAYVLDKLERLEKSELV